jgi:hypothetical protein
VRPPVLDDALIGARLLARVPRLVRAVEGDADARSDLARRLRNRAGDFLTLVKRGVFAQRNNPYHALLRRCGCDYGDLARLVTRDGLEAALRSLFREGVYLTLDELKGRQPIVRGSTVVEAGPGRLRNTAAGRHLPMRSSGSTGRRTTLAIDISLLREGSVDYGLVIGARGAGDRWRHATWGVPGGADVIRVLRCLAVDGILDGWFWQVDPGSGRLPLRYRWSAGVLRLACALGGRRLPSRIAVPPAGPEPIVRWMAAVLAAGRVPHLMTFPSAAVRVAEAARAMGVDLHGAQFSLGGEPTTAARLATVRGTGAVAVPHYGASELGTLVAFGCLAPAETDDLHLLQHVVAAIQPGPDADGTALPDDTVLLTSLRPRAPLILINADLGDRATLGPRNCGCALQDLGWTTHLHTIRSHRQLSAGGMTISDHAVSRILEQVLPAKLGGGPADYQLVEDEREDGRARIRLVIGPAVGPVDSEHAAEVFFDALAEDGPSRIAALQWRHAGVLQVERRAPGLTPGGKVLLVGRDVTAASGRTPADPC